MYKDLTERKPANRERRDEKINILMDVLLNPEKKLQANNFANISLLEKDGGFIIAFVINVVEEGDYDRTLVKDGHADYREEEDRMWLFCAERDCTQEVRGRTKDCAIPVILLSPELAAECTVIEIETLQPEVQELILKNFEVCNNILDD